jgi:hypothetical protein
MRKLILSAAAAAALMAATAANAVPTLVITLHDTADAMSTKVCTITASGLTGCSSGFIAGGNLGPGALEATFIGGMVGGYSVSFTSSTSNSPGTNAFGEVTLGFNNVLNKTSTGNLVVSAAVTGFTLPSGPLLTLTGSQSLSGNFPSSGLVGAGYFASASNATFASAAATGVTSSSLSPTTAASVNAAPVNWLRGVGEFSLENIVTFTLQANSSQGFQGGSNLQVKNAVPEPMTTALVGLGLFGAALFSRRRKSIKA